MKIKERIKVNTIIQNLAARDGVSPAEVRASIQEAIDEAWNNKTTDSAAAWLRYFPNGKKPSIEQFIATLGSELRKNAGS